MSALSVKQKTMKRLQQANEQATLEVESQIRHWENIKKDYCNLQQRLNTLSDKVDHNVMVPFGPLAFMPGRLIHTNELLVHLGASWFAEVSCKQGMNIIDHRMESVERNLDDLAKTSKNLKNKHKFADELDNVGDDNSMEIKEEVEKDYKHPSQRKRISRVKSQSTVATRSDVGDDVTSDSSTYKYSEHGHEQRNNLNNDELMKRLDELEQLEEEEDQLLLSSDLDERIEEEKDEKKMNEVDVKNVSWLNNYVDGKDADSDDTDEISISHINFKHTATDAKRMDEKDFTKSEGRIISPGDVGRVPTAATVDDQSHQHVQRNSPLSEVDIVVDPDGKNKRTGSLVTNACTVGNHLKSVSKSADSCSKVEGDDKTKSSLVQRAAISRKVHEHTNSLPTAKNDFPHKPISRFKQSRKK